MRCLWDRYPEFLYQATAPWPRVVFNGHYDWESSVAEVDSWLNKHIGARWVEWGWGWNTFASTHNSWQNCTVNFNRSSSCSLFLLRYGSGDMDIVV